MRSAAAEWTCPGRALAEHTRSPYLHHEWVTSRGDRWPDHRLTGRYASRRRRRIRRSGSQCLKEHTVTTSELVPTSDLSSLTVFHTLTVEAALEVEGVAHDQGLSGAE